MFKTKSLKNIYYAAQMIDSIEWQNDRSLAIRVTNLIRILVGSMYGETMEDNDKDPFDRQSETQPDNNEKIMIDLAIKARQSEQAQLESYNDLARTLDEKNRQLTERMKEASNG